MNLPDKKYLLAISLGALLIAGIAVNSFLPQSFEVEREETLAHLAQSIEHAEELGKYKCCIEPACTMCYQGHWIWDDGTCDCDGLIAAGEDDKVCPECVHGMEEGNCKSTEETEICVL